MSPQRPPHNPIAAIFRELRWLNGWMAAMILFGLVLALLERAGVGVTLSPLVASVEIFGVWLFALVLALGFTVTRPHWAAPETPSHEFFWNFCCASSLILAACLFSFVARPLSAGDEPATGMLIVWMLLFLAAVFALFGALAIILFNRAVKWSLRRAESGAPRGRFWPTLAAFLAHTARTLKSGER